MSQQASTAWKTGQPGNPDPSAFKPPHDNPDAVDHAQIGDGNDKREGGKDMGLVKPPIVSMHPTSQQKGEAKPKDFKVIDDANIKLSHHIHEQGHYEFAYPFADLTAGQGLFIPIPQNSTTDKFMLHMHKQVNQFRKQNSAIEKDDDGDDIMEDVAINKKKRNEDGTVQLDGDTPRLTVSSGFRPKMIGPTFSVKAVVKGDKLAENNEAESDGVLVIRMS